jgi:hypothetical protein
MIKASGLLGATEQRIAADDEPLTWIVRRADLGEIAIVEQRQLQLPGAEPTKPVAVG